MCIHLIYILTTIYVFSLTYDMYDDNVLFLLLLHIVSMY